VTLLPSLASGYDILVLQSSRAVAYEEVMNGFRSGQNVSQRVVVMSDYAEVDVARIVREDRPRMIVAVGDAALTASRTVRTLPVVAVMSLGICSSKYAASNLTGISMFVQPERYTSIFTGLNIRRVGVVYNAAKSSRYLKQARRATKDAGIKLVAREADTPQKTVAQLATLAGKVDALWMLPDTTAVTRETAEAHIHFGLQNAVPVISFASSYLAMGATAAMEIDRTAMGRQAFTLASRLLNGSTKGGVVSVEHPKGVVVKTNGDVLQKLGLPSIKLMSLVAPPRHT
jgi:putative ABC transport system substrate-binding protein